MEEVQNLPEKLADLSEKKITRRGFLRVTAAAAANLAILTVPSALNSGAVLTGRSGVSVGEDELVQVATGAKAGGVKKFPDAGSDNEPQPIERKIMFVNSTEFSREELAEILQGTKDSLNFWQSRGAIGASPSGSAISIQNYWNNESTFLNGEWRIRLASHNRRTAVHETTHTILGLRVDGLPAFYEGPAVMSQMLVCGGSVDSDQPVKVTNFEPAGKKFADYGNRRAMVENYNKAGVAALQVEQSAPGFWVAMGNRYYDWVDNQPNRPFGKPVSAETFHQWVNEFKPGLWETTQKFPILFLKP